MDENNILKKVEIRRILRKKGFRINNENIEKLSDVVQEITLGLIEKAIRKARVSGRKTIKQEDINNNS